MVGREEERCRVHDTLECTICIHSNGLAGPSPKSPFNKFRLHLAQFGALQSFYSFLTHLASIIQSSTSLIPLS
jgi:hypothetical protein